MNTAHLLARTAQLQPRAPALALGEALQLDYAGLWRRVCCWSAQLATLSQPGDRIVIAMHNLPDYLVLLFAAWHRGLVVVPVNAALQPREIEYCVTDSGAVACFTDHDHFAGLLVIKARHPTLTIINVEAAAFAAIDPAIAIAPPQPCLPEDPAWIFYTSGTTGRPKGATLSHRNLLAMVTAHLCDFGVPELGDCMLHHAPLSHASGLLSLSFVAGGALQVIPGAGQRSPEAVLALMRFWKRSSLFAAPTFLNRLVKAAEADPTLTAGVETIFFGGAPMYVQDLRRALAAFGPRLAQIYGQGESPMTIAGVPCFAYARCGEGQLEKLLPSVGWVRTGVEIAILDDRLLPLPPGEPGGVAVRGDVVMHGYWNMPEASAEALVDGWLHTGDIGCLDRFGLLTLIDRAKEVIISGGTNIYPREVEEILLLHPQVAEVSVIGETDPEWGENVVAVIVTRGGASIPDNELDALCLENMARFKRPKKYLFLDALPKSAYGKILKKSLKEQLSSSNPTISPNNGSQPDRASSILSFKE